MKKSCNPRGFAKLHGFTLIELIMVIVLMGVVGGAVAVFMRGPIDAYMAGGRRAALTDVADTAMRRIARDLHRALPNSVRNPSASCLEFIPTKTGGRYRADGAGALRFDTAVTSFNLLRNYATFGGVALPADQVIAAGDLVVVYNLGITGADAYAGDNYSAVQSIGTVSGNETPINIASKRFPLASGSNRFHVIPSNETLVSYICSAGKLLRRTDTAAPAATTSCSATTGAISTIATNVNCGASYFAYSGSDLERNALVTMVLSIQDSTGVETVNLQHEVHVDNTP